MLLYCKSYDTGMIKVTRVSHPEMLKNGPDAIRVIVDDGKDKVDGFVIRRVELRMYLQRIPANDEYRGPYTLVTAFVATDCGTAETTFADGFGGLKLLNANAKLLVDHLGLSALILRSIIALNSDMGSGS